MTIDIHGHFVDPHYLDELQRVMRLEVEKTSDGKTLMRHNGYTLVWTRPDMFDMDHRLRDMDAKRIERRVLSVSTPSVYPWSGAAQVRMARHVNDVLARDCRAHPDRFIGFASLPLHESALMLALGSVGPSQLLFGTDDPFIGADTAHVTRLPIAEAEKTNILGGNAEKMLGLA